MPDKPLPSSQLPKIIRRRVDIDFGTGENKRWIPVRPDLEVFAVMLSCFLPVGEKFFIRSVQHYIKRIDDPVLKEQAHRFVYQEAMHTKEHERLNAITRKAFPLAAKVEDIGAFLLKTVEFLFPASTLLAITCAIEHFTAMVADTALRVQEGFSRVAEPAFSQLWLWHAAEEIEHKAVCFDVYQHVTGGGVLAYLNRIFGMLVVSLCFLLAIIAGALIFKFGPKPSSNKARAPQPEVKPSPVKKRRFAGNNLFHILAEFVPFKLYLSYYKPNFHPWDHDNRDLLAAWKQRYPDFGTET